ncbi:MAG: CHRD domain-containing protein [Deinococcales bacterium]
MTVRHLISVVALALAFGLALSAAQAQTQIKYVADLGYLSSDSDAGCHAYQDAFCRAYGRVEAVVEGGFLVIQGHYDGLSSPVQTELAQGVHLHRDVELYHLDTLIRGLQNNGTAGGWILAAIYLTPHYELMLAEGRMYVDIHTMAYPDGEIRGMLRPITPLNLEVMAR